MMYALFKDGKQVSKSHSTIDAVMIEAFELKIVKTGLTDFGPIIRNTRMENGYDIKEAEDDDGK